MRNFLRGWRTFILSGLTAAVALLEILVPILGLPEFLSIAPPGWGPYLVVGVALLNALLRADTHTGPGRKE